MDVWVIDYALHLQAMKEAEYTPEDVAGFGAAVDACLAARGFEKLERLGLHASAKLEALSDAYFACFDLSAIDSSDKFITKLNLFRVKELNDLLPVLHAGNASSDNGRIREEIGEEYSVRAEGITAASTVAAVIQDLFLDGTGQVEHKPHSALRRRTPSAKAS